MPSLYAATGAPSFLLSLAASPPVSPSPPARQGTSHDGEDAWRSGPSGRECLRTGVLRRGGGEGVADEEEEEEEEEEETMEPKANSQRSRPWMLEVIGKMR